MLLVWSESSKEGRGGEAGVVISESSTGMETGMELVPGLLHEGDARIRTGGLSPLSALLLPSFTLVDRTPRSRAEGFLRSQSQWKF